MAWVLASGLLGWFFLYAFFRAAEVNWPESYFATSKAPAFRITRSPLRYAAFRFGPVFVVSLFVIVSLDRIHQSGRLGALIAVALHSGLGLGRVLARSLRSPRRLSALDLVRIVSFAGVWLAWSLALLLELRLASIVPSVKDLLAALWTGVAAATLGIFATKVISSGRTDTYDLVSLSLGGLPTKLRDYALTTAKQEGADPLLVLAVMTVENMQRPRWFRFLERLTHRLRRGGTYGIMQVRSRHSLSDIESIDLAIRQHLKGINIRPNGSVDSARLAQVAATYNGSAEYSDLLWGACSKIIDLHRAEVGDWLAGSEELSADGRPTIEVLERTYDGSGWSVSGTAALQGRAMVLVVARAADVLDTWQVQLEATSAERAVWFARVSGDNRPDALLISDQSQSLDRLISLPVSPY